MSLAHTVTLGLLIAAIPMILQVRVVFGSESGPRLDVTQLFAFDANSTCGGDPPTLFELRSGELQNCSLSEHESNFAVDGDPTTWWQSQNGKDPVALTFTLSEVSSITNSGRAYHAFAMLYGTTLCRLAHPSILCQSTSTFHIYLLKQSVWKSEVLGRVVFHWCGHMCWMIKMGCVKNSISLVCHVQTIPWVPQTSMETQTLLDFLAHWVFLWYVE